MKILPTIECPQDLKRLNVDELTILAQEIRQSIIDVMAINGGHLGSNMGIVELSIALHRTFNSPTDRFIFDVSHQIYPHKLLTGRQKEFPSIRQFKGLSGFANPEESPHDQFFAGHAGTALSLGLGVAKARDLSRDDFHVVPIIGDATFTCGLSLEALNNLPHDLKNFIVLLNDNNMSISDNVGAITHILGKDSAAHFEQYGFEYVGLVDGHNLSELLEVFEKIKNCDKPVLLHAKTVKGKGLEVAEQNPIPWHGCAPFDKVTGQKLAKAQGKAKFPAIFGRHLEKMAEEDSSIVTITPAMPLGSCISPLMNKFPERCIDVGIAEGHSVTYAGGIAHDPTKKVVCSIYSTFLQRAFDNLFQDVCLQKAPVVFALDRSGIATGDGVTHHGIYDISFLNAMPNMVICQPRDGHLLKELLESSFGWKRPTTIRYPNMGVDEPDLPIQRRPLGKGEVLTKGSEVALVALGHMCTIAEEVRAILEEDGVSTSVIDPIFVKPLDSELFTDIFMSHKCVVTIEEHAVNSGMGVIVNTFAMRNGFSSVQVFNFGIPETFLHQGSHSEMLTSIGLDSRSIATQILKDYAEENIDAYDHRTLSS